MKLTYANIKPKYGEHKAGICRLSVCRQEDIAALVEMDFVTGKLLTPVLLKEGAQWYGLDLVQDSYSYTDNARQSRAGSYREIKITGLLNYWDAALDAVLATLSQHWLVVQVQNSEGTMLAGDEYYGMKLTYDKSDKEARTVSIELFGEMERSPIFFN